VVPESIAPAIVPNTIHLATFTKDTVPTSKQQAEKQHAEKTKAEKLDIAQKSMDAAKIGMDAAQEAMKNIDWNQINVEINNAMKNVNWDEINENVQTAMKNIDWNKINEDIKVSVSNAQTSVDPKIIAENVRIGMQSAKAAMANFSSEDVKKHVAEAMEQAKKGIAQAQVTMTQSQHNLTLNKKEISTAKDAQSKYKVLIKKMTEDKLIDAEKGYVIAVKNGVLTINGEVQPSAVKDKYSKELGNVKELSIQGKDDNLIISEND
jgi:hypothetical protein